MKKIFYLLLILCIFTGCKKQIKHNEDVLVKNLICNKKDFTCSTEIEKATLINNEEKIEEISKYIEKNKHANKYNNIIFYVSKDEVVYIDNSSSIYKAKFITKDNVITLINSIKEK